MNRYGHSLRVNDPSKPKSFLVYELNDIIIHAFDTRE